MRVSTWFGAVAAVAMATNALAQEDPKALFQSRYDTFRSAMAAQDQAAVSAIMAPGYTMTDIQGEVRDASAVAAMMQRMPGAMGRDAKTTVLEAAVTGDTAAVKQQLSAKATRPGPDGNEMTMEFEVTSNDTWVKNGDAWQLKATVQKEVIVKRDGEVFFKQSN